MKKSGKFLFLSLLLIWLIGCAHITLSSAPVTTINAEDGIPKYLVLISIDAGRPEYLDLAPMPNLQSLINPEYSIRMPGWDRWRITPRPVIPKWQLVPSREEMASLDSPGRMLIAGKRSIQPAWRQSTTVRWPPLWKRTGCRLFRN